MPRASLIVGPFTGFSLSASYGQGVRAVDPGYIVQDTKTPFARIGSYEGGVTYTRKTDRLALSARSIFFVTHVARDLIFDETVGRQVLGEGTTRSGWAGNLRATGQFLDEALSLTVVKADFNDTHLPVPGVPGVLIRSDTVLFTDLPWSLLGSQPRATVALGATYIGPRPLPFDQHTSPVVTLDASANLRFSQYEIGLSVTNLTGLQYRLGEYNFASNFQSPSAPPIRAPVSSTPERTFTPGAPRTILASFGLTFGGE